jgi:hypothetical protein
LATSVIAAGRIVPDGAFACNYACQISLLQFDGYSGYVRSVKIGAGPGEKGRGFRFRERGGEDNSVATLSPMSDAAPIRKTSEIALKASFYAPCRYGYQYSILYVAIN